MTTFILTQIIFAGNGAPPGGEGDLSIDLMAQTIKDQAPPVKWTFEALGSSGSLQIRVIH
ncbi:hypothetical protein [Roseibium sediminicola]|uniref:Uncharacterized protein n=1 Tax=Roseibium sediminicola TaxID=2933272 RepID=A0ABT0GZP3_9HYPH|nr:hypothetical protein [Roseibium sp. CAU 1639]MCK7614801.1 hypothetical protein [Roseibium sp. CAU 1639]